MNVFLSWSGESSKAVAAALDKWLRFVFPEVKTWMSDRAIEAGARWGTELDRQLENTHLGVLCLSPDNLASPWMLFEAGALSKSVDTSRVVPYCIGVSPEEVQGPLSRFQGVPADKEGTFKLLKSINAILENNRADEDLVRIFNKWWPDLKDQLATVPPMTTRGPEQVTVRNILVASTRQFEKLGAEQDASVLEENYSGRVTSLIGVGLDELRDALIAKRYQIVHLLGYVEPSDGAFVFEDKEKLSAEGLLKLLQHSRVQLVFLATCDSLALGAKLARHMSVVAAMGSVEINRMVKWEGCFYRLLAQGTSLASSYDLAQATADVPMVLLIRNDALFLQLADGPAVG